MFLELAIIAPTASGKSDLAIHLATKFNAVILSLDSLSIYKEIDTASAKPTLDELKSVKHFGINLVYPDAHFSVGDFIDEYKRAKSYAQNLDIPLLITGGSGFYLKAMLKGLSPKIDDVEHSLSNLEIYELALKKDSEFASKFSQNDTYRLNKWYSIYKTTNEVPSIFLKENTSEPTIKNLEIYEIYAPKETLDPRIKLRTKKMIENRLIDEARYLFSKYDSSLKSLNSIGLKECKEYLDGKVSLSELESLITTHTIQLAKRQRTFNKSQFDKKLTLPLGELKNHLETRLKNR
ncbi:MAG: tRNA (adenosine(37)-N6)-dimethylallyltransferase MiaA [Campylobacteraceae bacterium]|nr:tRNA (adenosine(37)-N6)-dimethylallyltransferase MiaA [Campylobacteraceae bacterium]